MMLEGGLREASSKLGIQFQYVSLHVLGSKVGAKRLYKLDGLPDVGFPETHSLANRNGITLFTKDSHTCGERNVEET